MPPCVAFHLGLHYLPKYLFTVIKKGIVFLPLIMQVWQSSDTDGSMNTLIIGPKVINLFMLNSVEHEISTAHQNLNTEKYTFLAFKLSDIVISMLIKVIMPTHFNIYEHDTFHAQLN